MNNKIINHEILKEKNNMLEKEKEILAKLIYRSTNQHKSSEKLRKMIHLHRLLKKNDISKIVECCKKLYVICSSDLVQNFFIPLNITVMGIAARIFYIYNKKLPSRSTKFNISRRREAEKLKKSTVIDNIFN